MAFYRSGGTFLIFIFFLMGLLFGYLMKHIYIYLTRGVEIRSSSLDIRIKNYPLLEIMNGVSWACYIFYFEFGIFEVFGLFLISMSILVSCIDLSYYIIPNSTVITLLIAGIIYRLIFDQQHIYIVLTGFLVGSTLTYLMALLSKGGLGGGDIKLSAVMGLWLGFPEIITGLMIGSLIGGLIATLLLISGRKGHKEPIPFGPFLMIGFLYTFFNCP